MINESELENSSLTKSKKNVTIGNLSVLNTKKPSEELVSLLTQADNHLANFAVVWSKIKEKGRREDFTEKRASKYAKAIPQRDG